MEIGTTTGYVVPLTLTPVGERFLERLMINKLLGEVIVHHSNPEVCSSRRTTRSITLVGPRLIISRIHPLPGIVVYDHMATSTVLSCNGGVTM